MSNTQNNKGKAQVDFTVGRGFGQMGAGLPGSFLAETDTATALLTIAFVYNHPNPLRVNTYGQAMSVLALYGAGVPVAIDALAYEALVDTVEEYRSIMRAPEPHGKPVNEAFAAFVLKHAEARFRPSHGQCDRGMVPLSIEDGRGFGAIGAGLPQDFLAGGRQGVLATIAMLFTHPNPARVNKHAQAVAMLALYGAGAQVDLSKQQLRSLEKAAKEYESYMRGISRQRNEEFSRYARRQAVRAAKRNGII